MGWAHGPNGSFLQRPWCEHESTQEAATCSCPHIVAWRESLYCDCSEERKASLNSSCCIRPSKDDAIVLVRDNLKRLGAEIAKLAESRDRHRRANEEHQGQVIRLHNALNDLLRAWPPQAPDREYPRAWYHAYHILEETK